MSFWRYCPHCREMQDRPDIRSVLKGSYDCQQCKVECAIETIDLDTCVDELMDRIEAIEAKLGIKNDV